MSRASNHFDERVRTSRGLEEPTKLPGPQKDPLREAQVIRGRREGCMD